MTMLKIMLCSFTAMLVFFSASVLAESSAYQIELILFSQAMPNTEVFDQAVQPIHWPSGLIELSAYAKQEHTSLDDSYAALAKDSTYQPIMHVAWIQPVGEGGLSAPVHIQGVDGKLNGYLQVQQGQGLQLTVDLELNSTPGDGTGKPVVYRLNEKRPMKFNEIYYLDHPKLGAIVKISPL
ncbi:MAG: hypothetical protein EPN17_09555 [Methylobacter sp.]|nr:MAG: hypothetical protein EPN17_09555 [Methylobacter sp.]